MMLTNLLMELMQYPLVAFVLVGIAGILHGALWFRILQKTELPLIYPIVGGLCAFLSLFNGLLVLVPLLVAALKPWPVSEPPYAQRKRRI